MHITLFGGAFNPPHLGHQLVITQALQYIPDIDQLWILPDYSHDFGKNLVSSTHRINMINLLIDSLAPQAKRQTRLETFLFDRKLPGITHEYLPKISQAYPAHSFSFLLGSDNLATFKTWGEWPQLESMLTQFPFYIYPRVDYPFAPIFPGMHPLRQVSQINISSTSVRQNIANNQPITNLAPPEIQAYIKSHALYHS